MNKILVLVDCQNDFIDGSLGVGYNKWQKAYAVIEDAIKNGNYDKIVTTKDWHPASHCSFKENGGPWPAHCLASTEGADFYWKIKGLLSDSNSFNINKGCDPQKEEYGVDIYEKTKDIFAHADNQFEFHFMGLCFDYCVSECARMTAEHSNCKCYVVKNGSCAIDENATPNAGKAMIVESMN